MLSSLDAIEDVGETGLLAEAAVDGLRSCWGEGCRLMEAAWMVEAISPTRLAIFGSRR